MDVEQAEPTEWRVLRGGPTPLPLVDREGNLQIVEAQLGSLLWWQAGIETWLTQSAEEPTGWGIDWLWYTVWHLVETVSAIGAQTANAIAAYWSAVLSPIWGRIWGVLLEHYELAGSAWWYALAGADYAGRWVSRWLADDLWHLVDPVVAVADLLTAARGRVAEAGSVLDAAVWTLGVRAWTGLTTVREWANLTAAWVSHAMHPAGCVREDPWVWSAISFVGDLQSVLIESLVSPDLQDHVDALTQAFPIPTFAELFDTFTTESAADDNLLAVLEDFRQQA